MMGSRGYGNGAECDAFSRCSRSMLNWRRGALQRRFDLQKAVREVDVSKIPTLKEADHANISV